MCSPRILRLGVCLLLLTGAVLAQTSLGTITGTVVDATGAVVVGARVEARNIDTGVVYPGVSTDTGNYSIAQLPVGRYALTINVQGFKKYERQGLTLAAAQIMRIDVPLQVGSSTEAVTVTAEATLLKTESSELVHNVTGTMMQELPILSVGGAGSPNGSTSGFRDPFALVKLIPGIQYTANSSITANGNGDKSLRVEGQVSGNLGGLSGFTAQTQPSVDAIQEVAVQTSNYAAEFGDAGGAIINMTMKSGANQYHGSLYDYAVNEVLNAYPSMHNADRTKSRRHDYGGTFGGPVSIPKLYDGHNKTFFFWSWEQFRENLNVASSIATVPIDPYRTGNFQHVIDGSGQNGNQLPILVAGKPYVDQLGRTGYVAGQIFDPFSGRPVTCDKTNFPTSNCTNGVTSIVRDPFPTANGTVNQVPQTAQYMDPVAYNLQKLFPEPVGPNSLKPNAYGSNYQNPWLSHRTSQIPSIKVDQSIGAKGHLSMYWSTTETESQYSFPLGNMEGFPTPITAARGTFIYAKTIRANYDHTLTPTLLLHLGAGYSWQSFDDHSPVVNDGGYNAALPFTTLAAAQTKGGLGLPGGQQNRTFPSINIGASSTTGGMNGIGPAGNIQSQSYEERPSGNANVTWVKGNHNFKLGSELRLEGYPNYTFGADGVYNFNAQQTQQTSLADTGGQSATNSSTGFGYASFLMGRTSSISLTAPPAARQGRQQWGLFLQDTWKVTRKLTLDYGLRWDYGTYSQELYGRAGVLSLTAINQNAGNHPGGSIFEATCGCKFASNYPYQIGPRLGIAYQIDRKTVFRGGIGVVYQSPGGVGGANGVTVTGTPGANFGDPSSQFSAGVAALHPFWPDLTPGSGFTPGSTANAPQLVDPNAMRSPRIYQFSVGLQREVHRNLVVEASYVGNRGYWLSAGGLSPVNTMSVPLLDQFNFAVPVNGVVTAADLADRALLVQSLSTENTAQKSLLAAKGVGTTLSTLPYAGYPTNGNVRNTILPFPQYPNGVNPSGAPLGHSWYDSLQLVATQRLTHGLSLNANYTYAKSMSAIAATDPFNPAWAKDLSGTDLPHQFRFSADYVVPRIHSGNKILGNKVLAYVLGDWGIGWYLQYQSGAALSRPGNVTGAANAVNNNSPTGATFCPYTQGCSNSISDWLGYGPGGAQLRTDASGQAMNPWSVNWTDYAGVHHTDPIDINCHCYDPTKTNVFNPDAWVSVPTGIFAADDSTLRWFRGTRAPQENANISRTFRLKEKVSLQIRVEFTNVFHRLELPNPVATGNGIGFTTKPTVANGLFTNGFGTYGNIATNGAGVPRTGLFIARLQF